MAAPQLAPARGSDFSALAREVKAAGLLERRPLATSRRFITQAVLTAGVVWLFLHLGDSWLQLLVAMLVAVLLGQLAFAGHDSGHHQVFRRARANRVLGFVQANLLVGLSFDWWVSKHNRHHGNPNDPTRDPDIGDGVIAWTPAQMQRRSAFGQRIGRYQAVYFVPLLLLEGFSLKVSSIMGIARDKHLRRTEAALLVLRFAAFVVALSFVMSAWKVVLFVLIEELLFGLYLGLSFAPNHTGMELADPEVAHCFLRRQVLTARNIRGGPVTSVLFGGLNHQIEHHLFPSMPARNLRRSAPLVREFCARNGVAYVETSFWGAYRDVLASLRNAGRATAV